MSSKQVQTRQDYIDSVDKVAENPVVEEEQRILDVYEPALLHESDSDPDDIPDLL